MKHSLSGSIVCAMVVFSMPMAVSAAPPADACSILTPDQVSKVIGVPVGTGEALGKPNLCGWKESAAKNSSKRVLLDVFTPLGSLSPADRFEMTKKPVQGIPKKPAPGIGDEAVYATTPGAGTGLTVKKGTSVFQIRVYGFPEAQAEALEKTLAFAVLAKL